MKPSLMLHLNCPWSLVLQIISKEVCSLANLRDNGYWTELITASCTKIVYLVVNMRDVNLLDSPLHETFALKSVTMW